MIVDDRRRILIVVTRTVSCLCILHIFVLLALALIGRSQLERLQTLELGKEEIYRRLENVEIHAR